MAMLLSTLPNELRPLEMRFRQFLKWTLASFFNAAIIYGGLFFLGQSVLAGAIGLICLVAFLIGLVAWRQLSHSRLTSAVVINTVGLIGGALLVVLVAPALYPADALVPLLTVAAALPYLHGPLMRRMIVACWVTTIMIATLGIYLNLLGWPAPPFEGLLLVVVGFGAAGGLICLLLWQFSNRLNETLDQLRASNAELATKNTTLSEANQMLHIQIDQQRELLDLVSTLETPAVPLADGVVFAPIVGHVDSRRAQEISQRLLASASEQQARLVIIDIAGVSVMDTAVAQGLLQTAQALRLLGCEVTLSGISASIALMLTNLGLDMQGVTTVRSPQDALLARARGRVLPMSQN